jgi:hypothetical protein
VNLEIFGSEIGAQVEERQLTLEGITDESNETEGNNDHDHDRRKA